MITRVRMSNEEKAIQKHFEEKKLEERGVLMRAEELLWFHKFGDPECHRARELEAWLDNYWENQPEWEEGELQEAA